MPRQKIPSEKFAAARLLYLGGKGLRAVSKEIGIGYRQLAQACKEGGWAKEKESKGIGKDKAVAMVARAADDRALGINKAWEKRLGGMADSLAEIAGNVSKALARVDLDQASVREMCLTVKTCLDGIGQIKEILAPPKNTPVSAVNILIPNIEQAREVLQRRGTVLLPEQRRARLLCADSGESEAE